MKLFGIETCGIENTNAWATVEGAVSFQRITLTERHVPGKSWRREMERRMEPEQVRSLRLQCGITTPPERLTLVAKIRAYRNRLVETVGA